MTIKTNDTVIYTPWSGPRATAKVLGIERCEPGERYGEPVDSVTGADVEDATLELDNGHWCYGSQVKIVIS